MIGLLILFFCTGFFVTSVMFWLLVCNAMDYYRNVVTADAGRKNVFVLSAIWAVLLTVIFFGWTTIAEYQVKQAITPAPIHNINPYPTGL